MNCCFVEFASVYQANKALQKKNGEYLLNRRIFLVDVDEIAPYHSLPKYCMDHIILFCPHEKALLKKKMRHLPILLSKYSLLPISLPTLKYFKSSISSGIVEELLVFDLL